jgi:hypothetical protein
VPRDLAREKLAAAASVPLVGKRSARKPEDQFAVGPGLSCMSAFPNCDVHGPAMSASLKGFGCRPFAGALGLGAGPASESLVRRKARGGRGAVWLGASYGDLKVADGSRVGLRGREALTLIDGNVGEERVRSRAYEGLA